MDSQKLPTHLGIVLAGGTGSRLHPASLATCKQLMPVFDKPMVYYPLSTLLSLGCTHILVICNPQDHSTFVSLFSDSFARFGVRVVVATQSKPEGIPQALSIAREVDFNTLEKLRPVRYTLILGDNLFHVDPDSLRQEVVSNQSYIYAIQVANPSAYGVLTDSHPRIVEKPVDPPTKWAVTGLYSYPSSELEENLSSLIPSARGELEITDFNNRCSALHCVYLSPPCLWMDMGTPNDLLDASNYVRAYEQRTGQLLGCPELAAPVELDSSWRIQNLIGHLQQLGENGYSSSTYYQQLLLQNARTKLERMK